MDHNFPDGQGEQDPAATASPPSVRPEHQPREPVFNLPPAVLAALALIGGIYALQALLPAEQAEYIAVTFGFAPIRYAYPLSQQGLEWLWTPVTYSLLHGGLEHLIFNGLWLAAFGTPVVRRIGSARFVAYWIVSAAAGAGLHAVVNWGDMGLMIGASAVVSALMGSACRFAFTQRSRFAAPETARRLGIIESLRERTVLVFTGAWLFGNLAVAVGLPLFGELTAAIAWDAHIGGFLFGFLLFGLFDPVASLPRAHP